VTPPRRKLIEVGLPLDAINEASAREKSIRHGHPSTLHLWWARRPLAACRAVIFAQLVDDPSSVPEEFPDEAAQTRERERLHGILAELVKWENSTDDVILHRARFEIARSLARGLGTAPPPKDDPEAVLAFLADHAPPVFDPFCGGGSIPLEAQRLGLRAIASDLNPVAVLITRALVEFPPRFRDLPPVNPDARREGREARSERSALSRDHPLAEGDGCGSGSLPTGTEIAERGNIRHAFPDHPGGDVDSCQHRRRVDEGVDAGEGAVSGGRSGFAGGGRHAADPLRGSGLVSDRGDATPASTPGRDQPDAHRHAAQTPPAVTSRPSLLFPHSYRGARGLAEDVRHYGRWMREEAERRIGHLYPKVRITPEMAARRPDLKPYVGRELTVIAWLWARTVRSPNPAAKGAMVPLVSSFVLSKKPGKEAWVEIVKDPGAPDGWRFEVRTRAAHGRPPAEAKAGTVDRKGARCALTGVPIPFKYIRAEGQAGRMGQRLMAIVVEGDRGRAYLSPIENHARTAEQAEPSWKPDIALPHNPRDFKTPNYGMSTFGDLFTDRQLVALNTFADLVSEARERVLQDARAAGMADDGVPLAAGGRGATAFADAVAVYLAFALDKLADRCSTICSWDTGRVTVRNTFARQAIPMVWDFAEANALSDSTGNWSSCVEWSAEYLDGAVPAAEAIVRQADATARPLAASLLVSTDPPYYDNVGYADLSDFFYVWLRRTLRDRFPDLFATLQVPKQGELVAAPHRHGGREEAEEFFMEGMSRALHNLATVARDDVPATIYYAFKQKEIEREGITSTGWAAFLEAVVAAGFQIDGTWPIRTELSNRMLASGTNALANSIVLVCRRRPADAPVVSRREFLRALERELPAAVRTLQRSGISPVDLWQAAVGPGMAVFSRYAAVREADDRRMDVKTALALINERLDAVLAEQDADYDAETRFALSWYEAHGFDAGPYGVAETMAKARDVSVEGVAQAGVLEAKGGKVRLLRHDELPDG